MDIIIVAFLVFLIAVELKFVRVSLKTPKNLNKNHRRCALRFRLRAERTSAKAKRCAELRDYNFLEREFIMIQQDLSLTVLLQG